jgi:predicted MarR family transcription regulator
MAHVLGNEALTTRSNLPKAVEFEVTATAKISTEYLPAHVREWIDIESVTPGEMKEALVSLGVKELCFAIKQVRTGKPRWSKR